MIKRNQNQLIFANTLSDRWLRVAVQVADQSHSDACQKYWQGKSALIPLLEQSQGSKKRTH